MRSTFRYSCSESRRTVCREIPSYCTGWGSSPRPAGSRLAVSLSGKLAGSVSGGCIEGAVADAAKQTMASGAPQLLDFGISDERAWEVGLACGGKVKVFVETLS